MKNSNEPACQVNIETDPTGPSSEISKREMFAMAAMRGLLSNSKLWENLEAVDDSQYHTWFAEQSVMYANALLRQLKNNS